jgi:anti-anti-sigma regulatory factor
MGEVAMGEKIFRHRIVSTGNFSCRFAMLGSINVIYLDGSLCSCDRLAVKAVYRTMKGVSDICVIDIRGLVDFDETLYSFLLSAIALSRINSAEFIIMANPECKKRLALCGIAKQFSFVTNMATLRAKLVRECEVDGLAYAH